MSRDISHDRGIAAIWTAVVALFLMGSAAIAVDVSGAYQTARTDQTTADLSCLAGVAELPDDPSLAIDLAAEYVKLNWPTMAGTTLTKTGTTGLLADGAGNQVEFDAGHGGDNEKMRLQVTEIADTWFARTIGADSITVTQEAFCRVIKLQTGAGSLPFGALPGGFQGGLQAPNPCGQNSGNCGALSIPRDDVSGTGPTLIKNIAEGSDRDLEAWLGSPAGASHCGSVSAGDTCHIVSTDTGVSAAHLGEGMLQRLEDDPGATCTTFVSGRTINCDSPTQVLGSAPTPLMSAFPSQPGFWETSVNGAYNSANTTNHFYFDSVIAKCDSPRLATIPIVSENLNWNLGDPNPGWPNGKKNVKVIGRYWVIIVDPNDAGDWQGSGNLKTASSVVIWWGPNVSCQGPGGTTIPFDPDNPGAIFRNVKLVNDTN